MDKSGGKAGSVDSYEFVCGLALLSQSSLKDKAKILFELYDFDKSQQISSQELTILLKTTLTAINSWAKPPLPPPSLEDI